MSYVMKKRDPKKNWTLLLSLRTTWLHMVMIDQTYIPGGPVDKGIVAGPLKIEAKDGSTFPDIECVFDKGAYILKAIA